MNTHHLELEELLDIVDKNDQVVGQKYRSEIYANNISDFRVINAFLINSKNEIWIPRRSANKKLFPLCLDASVGGHVMSGESYEEAFKRELKEELNIESHNVNFKFLCKLNPYEHSVSAYMSLYAIFGDNAPVYNPDDFISFEWFSILELQEIIKNGEPAKSDLPVLIDFLRKLVL